MIVKRIVNLAPVGDPSSIKLFPTKGACLYVPDSPNEDESRVKDTEIIMMPNFQMLVLQ